MAACEVGGQEVQKVKGRVGRVGEVSRSCTCNFTLMIHYRWKMNKRSLMILRWMMDFVVFLSWFCLFQHSLSLSLSLLTTSHLWNIYFFYIYIFHEFQNLSPVLLYVDCLYDRQQEQWWQFLHYVLYKHCMLPFWLETHTHTARVSILSCI